jgi:hypothetical protein
MQAAFCFSNYELVANCVLSVIPSISLTVSSPQAHHWIFLKQIPDIISFVSTFVSLKDKDFNIIIIPLPRLAI